MTTKKKKRRSPLPPEVERLCKIKQILTTAEEMLTPKSWIQGQYARGSQDYRGLQPQFCAIGAVGMARRKLGIELRGITGLIEQQSQTLLDQATIKVTNNSYLSVVGYNDSPKRTLPEVKRVFKAAIREVEAEVQMEMER